MTQPRRVPAASLIPAVVAWLATALAIWLIAASHAWQSGCRVDHSLHTAGTLCLLLGGLLSVGAGVTGLIGLRKRGGPAAMGVAATVMGALGLVVCLVLFVTETSPHAVNPAYLHPC